jgi:hypothetical protein
MHIYMPGEAWEDGEFPSLLAIGDSWFWYPKNNLLQALIANPAANSVTTNIQVLGYNGADVSQYVGNGTYAQGFLDEIDQNGGVYYSGVMISGGGNDAVDYGLTLKKDCTGLVSAKDCMDPVGLDNLQRDISGSVGHMIHDIAWAFGKRGKMADIFLHGYDYPVPDGRGFTLAGLKVVGPWLKPALDNAKVDPNNAKLRLDICRLLIDTMHATLSAFTRPDQGIYFIDSRGILQSGNGYRDDWDNEMHPTPSGFAKIVQQSWIPVLRTRGYAK